MINEVIRKRITDQVVISETDCWNWTGSTNNGSRNQRPVTTINRTLFYVSRVVWTLWKGEIPSGLFVLHRCDNEMCVNPEHLWLGTQADNMKDASKKGRLGAVPITEELTSKILALRKQGMTYARIHGETKLSVTAIWRICTGSS